ncbi:hypothetical protein GCM10009555_077590 [Acrocarpospora macrocephala]|uniref:Uncharacterized protein n=1 Tax=Acrocarpospora macrocephala TaxID=150177 RepID=A0A5M3X2J8_9ACTN|nr:hypothetical protein Amac_095650 [Acrocarpospora macrocephala]
MPGGVLGLGYTTPARLRRRAEGQVGIVRPFGGVVPVIILGGARVRTFRHVGGFRSVGLGVLFGMWRLRWRVRRWRWGEVGAGIRVGFVQGAARRGLERVPRGVRGCGHDGLLEGGRGLAEADADEGGGVGGGLPGG